MRQPFPMVLGRAKSVCLGEAMADVVVTHRPEQSRYEARVGDTLAGFAQYQLTTELIVFTHTEVDDAFEGQGVGSALVQEALDDVRAEGSHKVLPLCPFVKGWISRHRDYVDLVYGAPRQHRAGLRARRPASPRGGDGRPAELPIGTARCPTGAYQSGPAAAAGPRAPGGPTSLGAKTSMGRMVRAAPPADPICDQELSRAQDPRTTAARR